jgi:maltose alpha-D-glucosyltransferase/alpha-amylase
VNRRRTATAPLPPTPHLAASPDWYVDAIIYELHVRAFADSNADGIGDFPGALSKLDYLADLGVTALWLLPFYPSPLRDDGYDIADYYGVHPDYGDLRSFRRFLDAAHERGLRVITELVVNHTSDQHPWFQRARKAPVGSVEREFYVWSDTPDRYSEARIIFQDFEHSNWAWDPVAGAYYWHRFYSHQPDLNYDNPAVREAVKDVLDHWLGMGVDGLRLDAVPYLFEREGTNCENLPETHAFLKELRAHVDERYADRMILAEANQWPEDAAAYFGDGDECHMNFHFPVMPRLFMSVKKEDRTPIIDILEQTPETPPGCQWAMFLRNHDELTLEMVTDEERDYMYRAYARDPQMRINLGIRRRLAPLAGNDRRIIELLNVLLCSMPGTPVLYYGDEIGMGDNVYLGDRDGVRTPMQWSPDRNAGFSGASPHRLFLPAVIEPEYHFQSINVEAQRQNPSSLLNFMRQLLALRKRHRVLARGATRFLDPDNPRVLAFVREDPDGVDEPFLVVVNLSRMAQAAELDLSDHLGATPIEAFGHTRFAPVGELPYYLTLPPYGYYWFRLERRDGDEGGRDGHVPAALRAPARRVLEGDPGPLAAIVTRYLRGRRWFAGKGRAVTGSRLVERMPLGKDGLVLALVEVAYADADPETYAIPLKAVVGERAHALVTHHPEVVLAAAHHDGHTEAIVDGVGDPVSAARFVDAALARRERRMGSGALVVDVPARRLRALRAAAQGHEVRVMGVEQSNTSVVVGGEAICKVIRRVHEGPNPDLELGEHLTRVEFPHTAPVLGSLSWHPRRGEERTLAVISGFVPNEGDAWDHVKGTVARFYEKVLSTEERPTAIAPPYDPGAYSRLRRTVDRLVDDSPFAEYAEQVELLGERTGELHLALASDASGAMAPEGLTAMGQRSLYQSIRSQVRGTLAELRRARNGLAEGDQQLAGSVIERADALLALLEPVRTTRLGGKRIRVHGDYHLGQVLWTGRDYVIIDFEGEPTRTIGERRIKRSPMADVAGMLRSFDYAAISALNDEQERGVIVEGARERGEGWARYWQRAASSVFLQRYLEVVGDAELLPPEPDQVRVLLMAHLVEKAAYEVRYELRHRPDWLGIPLRALSELAGEADRS